MTLPARMPADWPYRELSHVIAAPPHRWHVQIGGQGPSALLLHGAGGATHSWRELMPLLLPHLSVFAPDLPGQGFSTLDRRARAGLDPMAEDIARLLAHQNLRPKILIGHSAGAAIALRLVPLLPEPPDAVVAINAALGAFEGVAGWLFPFMAKLLALNPFVPRIFSRLSGTPEKVRGLLNSTGSQIDERGVALYRHLVADPVHVDGTLAMMSQWSLGSLHRILAKLEIPVLFVTGELDRAVPPRVSQDWAGRMQRAQFRVIRGAGHLVHEERPEEVADVILDFLKTTKIIAP